MGKEVSVNLEAWDKALFQTQVVPDSPVRPQTAIDADRAENTKKYKMGNSYSLASRWADRKKKPAPPRETQSQ